MDATDPLYEDVFATVEFLKKKVAASCSNSLLKSIQPRTFDTVTSSLFSLAEDYRSSTNSPTGALVIVDSPAASSANSSRAGSVSEASAITKCLLESNGEKSNGTTTNIEETVDENKAIYPDMPDLKKEESKEITTLLQKVIQTSNLPHAVANGASNENKNKSSDSVVAESRNTDNLTSNYKLSSVLPVNHLRTKSPHSNTKNARKPRPPAPPQQRMGRTQFQPILPANMQRRLLKPKPANPMASRGQVTNGKIVTTPLSPGEKSVKEVVADLCRDQQRLAAEKSSAVESICAVDASSLLTAPEKKSDETSTPVNKSQTEQKVNGSSSSIASSSFDSVMTDVIEGRVSTSLHDMQNSDLSLSSLKKAGGKSRSRVNTTKTAKTKRPNTDSKSTMEPAKLNSTTSGPMSIYPNLTMSTGNMISMPAGVQQFVIQASSASSMLGGNGGNLIPVQPMFIGSPAADTRKSGGPGGFHVLQVGATNSDNNNNTTTNGTVVRGYPPNQLAPSSMYLVSGVSGTTVMNDDTTTASTITSRVNHLKPLQPKATTFASAPSAFSRSILPNLSKSNGTAAASLAPSVRMTTSTQPSMSLAAGKTMQPTQYFYLPNGTAGLNFAAQSAGSGTVVNGVLNGGGPRVVQLAPSYLTAVSNVGGTANLAMLTPAAPARLIPGDHQAFLASSAKSDCTAQFRQMAPAELVYSSGEAPPKKKSAPRRKRKSADKQNADCDASQAPPLINFGMDEFTSSSDSVMAEEEEGENEPPPLLLQDEATSLHGLFLKEAVVMRQQFYDGKGERRTRPAIRHFIGGLLIEEDVVPFACENAELLNTNDGKTSPSLSENDTEMEVDEDKIDSDEKPSKRVAKDSDGVSPTPSEESPPKRRGRKAGRRGRWKRKIDSVSPSSSTTSATGDSPKESKQKTADGQQPPAKRGRKPGGSREVSGLLNMDFGPGKTPFQTTSIARYTKDVLEAKQRLAFVRRSTETGSTGRTPPPSSAAAGDEIKSTDKTTDLINAVSTSRQSDKSREDDAAEDEEERCRFCQQKFSQVERLKNKPQYCSKQCFQKHRDRKDKERSFRQFKIAKLDDNPEQQPKETTTPNNAAQTSQPPNVSQSTSSPNSQITSPISVLAKRLPCNTSPSTLTPARNSVAALHTQRGINSPPSSAFQLKPLTPRKSAPIAASKAGAVSDVPLRQSTSQWSAHPPYHQFAMSIAPSVGKAKSPQLVTTGQPPQRQLPVNMATQSSAGVVSFIPSGVPVSYNNFIYALPQQPHHLTDFAGVHSQPPPRFQPPTMIDFPSSSAASGLFSPLLAEQTPPSANGSLPTTEMSSAERDAEIKKLKSKNVATWKDWEVAKWVSLITTSDSYAELFMRHNIDGTDLPYLDLDRMKNMGLKLGPGMKLTRALHELLSVKVNPYGAARLHALYAENADLQRLIARGIDNWTRDDVNQWASIITNSSEIGQRFFMQDIDGGSLKLLERQQFLVELNIRFGPTLELEEALKILQAGS